MFLSITEEENELIKVKIFLILWLRESSRISPKISDQSSAIHRDSLHTDNYWSNWTAWEFWFISFSIRWNVTCQHDRQDERLIGQLPSQSRHCPFFWPAVISSPAEEQEKSVWSRISLTESRVSVVIGHLHDHGVILPQRQESVRFLLSCTN